MWRVFYITTSTIKRYKIRCFGIKTINMNKDTIKYVIAFVLLAICGKADAQWSLGLRTGCSSTTISRYDAGRMDESYSALTGISIGLQGRYTVNPWLAVRANPSFMQRSHRMDRNLNYLDPVYTEHINNYLMLPLLADLSFGGERLRGHMLAGAYAGYWLSERRRGVTYWMTDYYVYFEDFDERRDFTESDLRFNAGMAIGASLSYSIANSLDLYFDAIYYYDLTSHHKGYAHLADPRYLNTLELAVGINYSL